MIYVMNIDKPPLHLAINYRCWNIARYYIEQVMELAWEHKKDQDNKKYIQTQNKLIDKDGAIKIIDDKKILNVLDQKGLKEILSKYSLVYCAISSLKWKIQEKNITEEGVKELHVQLTIYWDYIAVEELKNKCPGFMSDWSCNHGIK
ncbi:hypothetical protein RFI_38311 [Reticulomyxa filosa]|uniref:Uncharacterized protein n=1 Tax=Reticulomyxa filosa TaxID=46433 RepID=X6LCR6_RETFI|nr:hypothetical protein RFI_38311 [Reticulomyxa filosa]|eukprot:ETN99170.1 hypothetical protein RFI_38311 [Reticulomyxa filosa]